MISEVWFPTVNQKENHCKEEKGKLHLSKTCNSQQTLVTCFFTVVGWKKMPSSLCLMNERCKFFHQSIAGESNSKTDQPKKYSVGNYY